MTHFGRKIFCLMVYFSKKFKETDLGSKKMKIFCLSIFMPNVNFSQLQNEKIENMPAK